MCFAYKVSNANKRNLIQSLAWYCSNLDFHFNRKHKSFGRNVNAPYGRRNRKQKFTEHITYVLVNFLKRSISLQVVNILAVA